jgi:CheY-like chemotaxis protein
MAVNASDESVAVDADPVRLQQIVWNLLKALLTESGALVMATTSGVDALRIGAESEFDVVLSDISMPGMDGFEFLRNFKLSASTLT